ncbi:MAG: protein-glutamate O-methyltransferase CheR [Candidatus Auribacter fodinae]|jgi:chemotaxis protein methyltransferase CheR|uniref:protein-glutamate O-methyltransferase n=1 Tax=Candidatus Auribacter fodinae TaxID=2093366 RepID=A0A3A4QTZ2_9BACT|nr:MAG: protein-glutamate O-methyltransferase CheR [Candidatus Auribacter fodinae]
MDITNEEFEQLTSLIKSKSGLFFEPNKMYFIERRLLNRMSITNCESVKDYLRLLKYDLRGTELNALVDSLTTNETYFYRELPQLMSFVEGAVPLAMEGKKRAGVKTIKIWSAACSVGCEPYTIAVLLKEHVPDIASWHVQIIGTDISNTVLKTCREGRYTDRYLKDIPPLVRMKYFKKTTSEDWEINHEIKQMVQFSNLNLVDRVKMRSMAGFDFIFCRNALIYFNEASSKEVVSMFYDSLNKGGFIFLGHSESVARLSAAFQVTRLKNSLVYQKR